MHLRPGLTIYFNAVVFLSGLDVTKRHRKLVCGADSYADFHSYVKAVISRMSGLPSTESERMFVDGMNLSYEECRHEIPNIRLVMELVNIYITACIYSTYNKTFCFVDGTTYCR